MTRRILETVSLIIIDTIEQEKAAKTLKHCSSFFKFKECYLFTDVEIVDPQFKTIKIPKLTYDDYSRFMIYELSKMWKMFVHGNGQGHVLVIQNDGFILNPEQWDFKFLEYDYIGAPFSYNQNIVGNGGFSLRSVQLLKTLYDTRDKLIQPHPEDKCISETNRELLEWRNMKFPSISIAKQFSEEIKNKQDQKTFGFHSKEYLRLNKIDTTWQS